MEEDIAVVASANVPSNIVLLHARQCMPARACPLDHVGIIVMAPIATPDGYELSRSTKKLAKSRNFLPAKLSTNKVT